MCASTAATTPSVVKVGGAELGRLQGLWQDIAREGPQVVVHGGGAAITSAGKAPATFHRGRRVTDADTARIAADVLIRLGEELAEQCRRAGVKAVRLGVGAGTPIALEPLDLDLYGRVGRPAAVDTDAIMTHLARGTTVLVTPIGRFDDGEWLNVNADDMASGLASALTLPLVAFTDVPGVIVGGDVRRRLAAEDVMPLVDAGEIRGGMVAKVEAALEALAGGAPSAWIGPLTDTSPLRRARTGEQGTTVLARGRRTL